MYTFFERQFHKESIEVVRFLAKNCIFEKSPKIDFFGPKFFEQG